MQVQISVLNWAELREVQLILLKPVQTRSLIGSIPALECEDRGACATNKNLRTNEALVQRQPTTQSVKYSNMQHWRQNRRRLQNEPQVSGRRSCSINNQIFLSIKVPPPWSLLTTAGFAFLSPVSATRRLKSSANSSISRSFQLFLNQDLWSKKTRPPHPLPGTLQQNHLTHSSVQLRSSAPAAAAAAGIRSSAACSSWLRGR